MTQFVVAKMPNSIRIGQSNITPEGFMSGEGDCSHVFTMAQRLDSISHAIFSFPKIPILSHKPLRMGAQPQYEHFRKTLLFFYCKSNARYKDKDCMTDVTFIRSISVLHS